MIKINGITIPENTGAIKLEPSNLLDKAVIKYDKEKDILYYSVEVLIECFQESGMTEEEAWEWFHYNTLRTANHVANYPEFIYKKE
jgi:hypothetical protein